MVKPEPEIDVSDFLKGMPEVKEVLKVEGEYPNLVRVESDDMEAVRTTVSQIRHAFEFRSTMCLIHPAFKRRLDHFSTTHFYTRGASGAGKGYIPRDRTKAKWIVCSNKTGS